MRCAPTRTPDDVDVPALQKKYLRERDKRLRPEGQTQYVRPIGGPAGSFEADPHRPMRARAPISEEIDVIIL